MSGETVRIKGTPKTLEANGALIANNTIVQANDATYSVSADGAGFEDGTFALGFTYGTTPTEGTVLALLARPMDIDGTNDAQVPETSRPVRQIGIFVVDNVTTAQYAECTGRDLPDLAEYYIHNVGTGQSVSAGWTLKVTPRSRKAA